MTAVDEFLVAAAVARLAAVGSLDDGHAASAALTVAVVVDHFAPESFVAGTIDFALAVPESLRAAWHRSFTRTVFLAGRPGSVAARYPARSVSADAGFAWHGPAPAAKLRNVSRLLRAFHGPLPVPVPAATLAVSVPGPATGHTVHADVAVGGVSVRDYLVHVHHLFAEATLRGLIRPGDAVRVRHRPELNGPAVHGALDPARADIVQTRVARHCREPERLRLYGAVTSDRGRG